MHHASLDRLVTGWLFNHGLYEHFATHALAIIASTPVVFVGGSGWLATIVGWPVALAAGVVPFLIGDALKTLLAAAAVPFVRDAAKSVPQI